MGCGASTQTAVAPETGGTAPSAVGFDGSTKDANGLTASMKQRRMTQTVRRAAVSNEDSGKMVAGGSAEGVESLKLTPKPADVTEKLLAALQAHPLFEHLAAELMHQCIEAMEERKHGTKGAMVIEQGDAGDHFYLAYSGTFEAYDSKPDAAKAGPRSAAGGENGAEQGEEKEVNELGLRVLQVFSHGECFGELALLYNAPRACSVRTTSDDAVAYALGRTAFRTLVMTHQAGVKHGLEKYLSTIPLLRDLTEKEIRLLADVTKTVDVEDGEYIVEIGEAADCLFLVLTGEVVCHRETGQNEIMRLKPGEFFGESCLSDVVENRQRLANVVAVGHVRVGCLKRDDFLRVAGSLTGLLNMEFNRKAIAGVSLLEILTPVEVDDVLKELVDTTVEAGHTIITMGETGKNFYIIKSGSVRVYNDAGDLATLGQGEHFGERALLTEEKTVANVVATGTTQLMSLDRESFERVLPPLQDLIARAVAERDEQAARAARPKILMKDLKLITVLGEGTFGRVRLTQWVNKSSNKKMAFALKTLQKGQLIYYKQVEHVVNEKQVLESCFHPFILKLEAVYNSTNQVYMLLEVALGGELFTHLRSELKFAVPKAALYAAMVSSAFAYLHARRIAHRDLKPENLLFDKQGYLKLVDFGFAKVINDRTWTLCGTPEYLAPEIISNRGHNCGADWWTLGILIYEMLVGQPPFVGGTQLDTYQKITRGKYKMPTNLSRATKDVISRLLMHNPAARLGCSMGGSSEVTTHDFFVEIEWPKLEKRELTMPHVPTIRDEFDASNFDQYSDDDGAGQWVKYNTPQYEQVWKAEFEEK